MMDMDNNKRNLIITYNSEDDVQQLLCWTAPAPALQTRGVQPDLAQARSTLGLGLLLRSRHGDTAVCIMIQNNHLCFTSLYFSYHQAQTSLHCAQHSAGMR